MNDAITHYLEAAYALLVVGLALSPWPFTALLGAAGYLIALAVLHDRRTPTK